MQLILLSGGSGKGSGHLAIMLEQTVLAIARKGKWGDGKYGSARGTSGSGSKSDQ